jgi:hypothetical protein
MNLDAVIVGLDPSGRPPAASRRARPERPILLAVDEQLLGEGAALRVAPELADPVGSLEVGEHEDVEQLGAGGLARARPGELGAVVQPDFEPRDRTLAPVPTFSTGRPSYRTYMLGSITR